MDIITYDRGVNTAQAHKQHREILHRSGLRATPQRLAFLSVLHNGSKPQSVEELTHAARGVFDLATGYRIADAFVTARIARRIELSQGRALYEIFGEHHHHAVCTRCGNIEDIHACLPSGIDERVRKASSFYRIDDHQLEFFGICMACSKKL